MRKNRKNPKIIWLTWLLFLKEKKSKCPNITYSMVKLQTLFNKEIATSNN